MNFDFIQDFHYDLQTIAHDFYRNPVAEFLLDIPSYYNFTELNRYCSNEDKFFYFLYQELLKEISNSIIKKDFIIFSLNLYILYYIYKLYKIPIEIDINILESASEFISLYENDISRIIVTCLNSLKKDGFIVFINSYNEEFSLEDMGIIFKEISEIENFLGANIEDV
ncbi:hypothetical protein CWI39_0405p0010 [Hamiltosporidium magnivora]|uniref:Uncharacterized protein n=1 Tax=Hamiltosporidium magnivora TaxID=148818 RepID=A0A4V2JW71_9MICR|nr:hypothetical protein CWI39_0405p0010 [Hamiltosporidium magnivora]